MSSAEDIESVRAAEESRGRRIIPQGLTVATPARREADMVTPQIKVQRFGGLIVRLGEAIEGVPPEDARAALLIVLDRLQPTVTPEVPRPPVPTPRPKRASAPRTIHASADGEAAALLRRTLKTMGGRATTRQLAERVGKSVSTVTHTLRAMKVHRPQRGVWELES